MPICMQQARHLLHQQVQFSDGSATFPVGILENIKGQMKNQTKVWWKVDEAEWITIQETAAALDISSGCVSNILTDKLLFYSKVDPS